MFQHACKEQRETQGSLLVSSCYARPPWQWVSWSAGWLPARIVGSWRRKRRCWDILNIQARLHAKLGRKESVWIKVMWKLPRNGIVMFSTTFFLVDGSNVTLPRFQEQQRRPDSVLLVVQALRLPRLLRGRARQCGLHGTEPGQVHQGPSDKIWTDPKKMSW